MTIPAAARRSLLLAAITFTGARTTGAQAAAGSPAASREKATAIQELLQLSHTAELMRQGLSTGIEAQKMANPQVPAVFWAEFLSRDLGEKGEMR